MGETENKNIEKYQWIKGEKSGQVEQVKNRSDGFIYFNSGNRVKEDIINEFMIKVNSDTDMLDLSNKPISNPSDKRDATADINVENQTKNNNQNKSDTKTEKKTPLQELLDRQSKNNEVNISVNISINIPKKEVVDILQESFEDDVVDNIIKDTQDKLKNDKTYFHSIEESIRNYIKDYYGRQQQEIYTGTDEGAK